MLKFKRTFSFIGLWMLPGLVPLLADIPTEARNDGDGIEDRDLVFLRLGSKPDLAFHESLTPEAIRKLRDRYEIHAEPTVFILIGKDGGEKDRQESALDLPAWFDRIDAMPMRRGYGDEFEVSADEENQGQTGTPYDLGLLVFFPAS